MSAPGAARWLRALWGGRARRVAAAYRASLGGAPDVLADLARLCHAMHPTIVPGDPLGTAFNEGKRAVWLHVAEMLALSPDDFPAIPEETRTDDRDRF